MDLKCTITINGQVNSDEVNLNVDFNPPLEASDDVWTGTGACGVAGKLIERIGELLPKKGDADA